jgi:hypothetical protein
MRDGDPLELEKTEILRRICSDIGTLIFDYGMPPVRVEEWVNDAIESAEELRDIREKQGKAS